MKTGQNVKYSGQVDRLGGKYFLEKKWEEAILFLEKKGAKRIIFEKKKGIKSSYLIFR